VRLARSLDDIFKSEQSVSVGIRERFLQMCAIINREGLKWSGNQHLAREWNEIDAVGIAHGAEIGPEAEQRAEALFLQQEAILLKIFEYAQKRKARIINLATDATAANLSSALKEVVTLTDEITFFQHLRKPELLPELGLLGVFDVRKTNRPHYWPPADFLATIASEVPEEVAAILKELPVVPSAVIRQLLAAALKLPDSLLENVARESAWFSKAEPLFGFSDPYFKAVERLVASSHQDLAIKRATKFLRLVADGPKVSVPGFDHPNAIPACGMQFFEFVLRDFEKSLEAADPLAVSTVLANTLDAAVSLERRDKEELRAMWVGTMIVLGSAYNDTKKLLLRTLLSFLRRAAKLNLRNALEFLRTRPRNSSLYQRAAASIIWEFGSKEIAMEVLRDPALWTVNDPEHLALLERFFPQYDETRRLEIAQIGYSSLAARLSPYYESHKVVPSEITRLVDIAFVLRFGGAAATLPSQYASAVANYEQSKKPTDTAVSLEELSGMPPREAVAMLQALEPQAWPLDEWGIGMALRAAVQSQGGAWLEDPAAVRDIPDQYLGWFLNGMSAYQREAGGGLAELLDICDTGILRAQALWNSEDEKLRQLALRIVQGTGQSVLDLAKEARDVSTIQRLTDLARTLGRFSRPNDGAGKASPWDAANAALGDPLGIAVNLAAELLAIANRGGFDYSQIIQVYDEMTKTDSVIVRGALGQWFSWFASVSPQPESWVERIFLSGDDSSDLAAWSGYVLFSQVNQLTHRLLANVYARRLGDLTLAREWPRDKSLTNPDEGGVEARRVQDETLTHIWVLIANRVERLDDPLSLSNRMLDVVDARLLEHLLGQIAISLPHDDDAHSRQVREEAMRLWGEVVRRRGEGQYNDSILRALPSLIRSNSLPATWRFEQAEYLAAHFTEATISDWQLVQDIRDLAAFNRKRALRVLESLAKTTNMAILPAIQMYTGPLLRAAHSSGDDEERHIVDSVISILVSNQRPNILEDTSSDAAD
jgi:hypothetical protein